MSQNSTLTCFISPGSTPRRCRPARARPGRIGLGCSRNPAGASPSSDAPHWPQNRFSGGLAAPHDRTRRFQRRPALAAELHSRQDCLRGTESTSNRASKGSAPGCCLEILLTLAASCTKVKFGDPSVSPPLTLRRRCSSYEVSTVRSAVIDGMKKYAAAVRIHELFGYRERRPPVAGRVVRIRLIHLAGAVTGRLPDDRVKPRRHLRRRRDAPCRRRNRGCSRSCAV